jgi:RNA polymerase sigma factor (sigma-70 family)
MDEPSAPELTVVDRAREAKLTPAEQAAFAEFYTKNKKKVLGVSVRRCAGDRELAEEAFQEVFVLVGHKWRELEGLQPVRQQGWLFTALEKIVERLYTKRRDHLQREAPAGDTIDLTAASATRNDGGGKQRPIDEVVADRVAYQQLLALAPAALSEREFQVVFMTHILGFKRVEIAAMLDVPAGTIRSDLSRAMARLRAVPELQRLINHFMAHHERLETAPRRLVLRQPRQRQAMSDANPG